MATNLKIDQVMQSLKPHIMADSNLTDDEKSVILAGLKESLAFKFAETLTIHQAAKFLQVSEKSVYRWCEQKIIPFKKIGGVIRIRRDLLMKWFEEDQSKIQYLPFGDYRDDRRIKTAIR